MEIERVIDGHGNLAGHALQELNFGIGDALRNQTAETHRAQAALRRGQGNHGQRANADVAQPLQEIGEAAFFFRVADDKGLLRLPNPTGWMALHGRFAAGFYRSWETGFQYVEAHDVAHRVVKHKCEEVKIHHRMKPFGKVVICAGTTGIDLDFNVAYLWMRQKEILGSHFANAYECTKANELIESGQIRPVLWRTLGFDGVADAHQLMRENKHLGKIAILVGADAEGQGKTAEGPGAIHAEVGA